MRERPPPAPRQDPGDETMRWPTGAGAQDVISAVVFLTISIVGFIATLGFPERAAAWPQWMFGLLGLFSLVLLVIGLRRRNGGDATQDAADKD